MAACIQVQLNGIEVWGLVEPDDETVRIRMSCDDWDRLGLCVGHRVRLTFPHDGEGWLYLDEVDERPPFVWVRLAERLVWAEPVALSA
jgi:hypothetical protein